MTATGIEIWPFTPEWAQWIEYHRGSKTEARMLECLPFKDRPAKPFFAPAQFPPAKPDPAKLTPVGQAADAGEIDECGACRFMWSKFCDVCGRARPTPRVIRVLTPAEADARRKFKAALTKTNRVERKKLRRMATKTADVIDQALVDVNHNQRPCVADDDLEVRHVEDPDDKLLVVDGSGVPMRSRLPTPKRYRLAELRDDPIGKMAKLGRLGISADRDVRLMAARKWQELYDLAADHKGLNQFNEVVDGGKVDDIAESRLTAVRLLSRASAVFGMRNENLIFQILGIGHSLEEYLKWSGMLAGSSTRRQKAIDAHVEILRNCLDDLAFQFGYRVAGKRSQQQEDFYARLARVVKNPLLRGAVNRTREALFGEVTVDGNGHKPTMRMEKEKTTNGK